MAKYNIYHGQFPCHTCGEIVFSIRSYPSEKLITWMCRQKHVSEVNLKVKKSKKDYE